ncbi:recombinase family protein [Streptomyces sp. NPDC059152]|uniref:recombinase family protein n=1 Tax=Streptomyces sp. NPDC059152 TaxID=3346742 RepID=UPI00367AFFB1
MTATKPPLAFVYDRCASHSRRQLGMRLAGCQHYADRMGWPLAGHWCDLGAHALTMHRPQLAALLTAMHAAADHHEVLCLVHTLDRLATDATHRQVLQHRVVEAGGRTVTTFDEPHWSAQDTALVRRRP